MLHRHFAAPLPADLALVVLILKREFLLKKLAGNLVRRHARLVDQRYGVNGMAFWNGSYLVQEVQSSRACSVMLTRPLLLL